MKFAHAKKVMPCQACEVLIERNDEIVLNFVKSRARTGSYTLVYHLECYIPWYTNMFSEKYREWKFGAGNTEPRPRLGRPPTYEDPNREQWLNRLRSNISYNKKRGNQTKVKLYSELLEKELSLTLH